VGKVKSTGLGVGGIIGVLILVILVASVIIDFNDKDDARMARIQADYSHETDRLTVALILTNQNGDYTKANGHLEIRVLNDNGRQVYSNEFDFTKNDFVSWQNNVGGKTTGYLFSINKYFSSYGHDVFVDLETKSGKTWKDIHARFFSLE